ncbi:kinase-like domain-containing protein [Chytriomyces cf. hyalinus JEL632]|nr:kinase-like domain-containing protein [Chytriomyces cf. hyalinus JEL632]
MSLVAKKNPLQAAGPISANLPPLIKQQSPSKNRTPSVTNVSAIPANAAKAPGRPSVVKFDPEVPQNEAETLGAVTRKLSNAGSAANVKGSTQTLTPKEALEKSPIPRKATVKTPAAPAINLPADPIPKRPTTVQRNKLELPSNFERPISAPYNNNDDVQEARIHANFMGNNLKSKKLMKEKAVSGNLTSNDRCHTFSLQDFEIREQIGKGAFARVHVVGFKRQEGEPNTQCKMPRTYAMKSLRKADIVKTKQIKHVMSEKNILNILKNPFIVDLVATFQDTKHLYLVLEYIPGGDMFSHIRKHVRFQESIARFYTCEILLALEYIHSKDVVYRDLKPENILIDPLGHIKIADFGFAKVIPRNHATTFCGTPAYMAPEIIMRAGYTKAVDWWSFGTVCYELMAGYGPFQADSPLRCYERILNFEMRWSSQIGDVAKDLLSKLLQSNPGKRLGINGAREIKAHPWFRTVNWKEVESCSIPVPFVPSIVGDGDIQNFDVYTDQSSVVEMQLGTIQLTSEDNLYNNMFPDF